MPAAFLEEQRAVEDRVRVAQRLQSCGMHDARRRLQSPLLPQLQGRRAHLRGIGKGYMSLPRWRGTLHARITSCHLPRLCTFAS